MIRRFTLDGLTGDIPGDIQGLVVEAELLPLDGLAQAAGQGAQSVSLRFASPKSAKLSVVVMLWARSVA